MRASRASRRRIFSSPAAASVNVIATTRSSVAVPVTTRLTRRSTRTVVLPVPAPASSTRWCRSRADAVADGLVGRRLHLISRIR